MRKRTQQVRGYRDGGRVSASDIPDAAPAAVLENAPPPEAADVEAPAEEVLSPEELAEKARNETAVAEALARQRHAEEMQRLSPIERQLREMGMSQAEAWFALAHPETLMPENIEVVRKAYHDGQRAGLRRDSKELFGLVMVALDEHKAAIAGADRLDRDVDRVRLTSAAQGEPVVPTADVPATPPLPAIPPPARSMPMAAPVQREAPSMSGRARRDEMKTLTEDERKAAHESIPDRPDAPNYTPLEKEYIYLQNKRRLAAMRASGEYSDIDGRRR